MSTAAPVTSHLCLNQHQDQAELHALLAGGAALFSRRSPEKEPPNEDGALLISIDEHTAVLAVADGCGGMSAGEQAARLTLETIAAVIKQAPHDGTGMRAAILDGIEKANAKVMDLGTGAAATLAVVEICAGKIRPYHVGDSQILLVGNRGKVKLETCAHSPVAYAVEAGMLSAEEAIHHEERHLVSNVIGARDSRIEIGAWRKMSTRDTLLIASDGIFDNLHSDEVVEIIRKGPLDRAAGQLVEQTRERMQNSTPEHPSKPDDMTFILFRGRS